MEDHHDVKVGSRVGAGRWPYAACHPDCWGKPWQGLVLAVDDPRAWAGTLAFPGKRPNREAVKAHVAWCRAQGLLDDRQPVLWAFGDRKQVYWESAASLRPYAQDLEAWTAARQAAYESRKAA